MYSYGAGSPKTYRGMGTLGAPRAIDVMGPGYGTYLQEGHPLSYAPRFGALGTSELYAAGSPGTFRDYIQLSGFGALDPTLYKQYRDAGMSHEAATEAATAAGAAAAKQAESAATGQAWASGINAVIGGLAQVYQISAQQKLIKQQQHQAARERAAQLELAKTQTMYVGGGSIKPAQGSTVMLSTSGPAAGGALGKTAILVGGVIAAGAVAVLVSRGGRRRRR